MVLTTVVAVQLVATATANQQEESQFKMKQSTSGKDDGKNICKEKQQWRRCQHWKALQ